MKTTKNKFFLLVSLIAAGWLSIKSISANEVPYQKLAAFDNSCDCYSTSSLQKIVIKFNNQVPGDLPSFNSQSQADCFAWQEFIALNWPTNPNSSFGNPGDTSPVAWENYMPKDVLFTPDGSRPPAWGTLVSDAFASKFKTQRMLMRPTETKLLTFTAKFEDSDPTTGLDPHQAAPFGKPNWLGAQNGTNVWYEIMLNQDYYNFVVQNGFYNAITQHDTVSKGKPINFPQGVYNGPVGAIELKAAWMEVDNSSSPKWNRYKLSKAVVMDATTGQLRNTTVALVGLHILHKTKNQPTWVWATFEHTDNVPDTPNEVAPPYGYNFYSSSCSPNTVTLKNGSTATVTCTANTSPPYYLKQGKPVPIQISRVNSIDPVDAVPINTRMQNNIQTFYPNSVFQYYQLVDVIWSQILQPDPTTPIQAPRALNNASMMSGKSIVANTTMESYVQNTNTCISCHKYSTIAPYAKDTVNNNVFGDFSFAISAANYPKTPPKKLIKKSLSK